MAREAGNQLIEVRTLLDAATRSSIRVQWVPEERSELPNRRAIKNPLTLPEWPTEQ